MPEELFKIIVFTPISHADKIRTILSQAGAGHIGNYDNCSFSSRGIGRFRGLAGSKPFISDAGEIEEVPEEKIEVICSKKNIQSTLDALVNAHPYEEPAIDVLPLINHQYSFKKTDAGN